jgi:uncharacterized membrane protein
MRGIYRFLRSTILGGLVVLLPLMAAGAVVMWAVGIAIKAIRPVLNWMPDSSVGGVSLTLLMAIIGVVACCFLAGLLAETAVMRGLGRRAERLALTIPGYALMKNVGANVVGVEGQHPVQTVLVRFEATWQLGFLMETLSDDLHVVFVPGVPKALVGSLHIVSADRVQILKMSVSAGLDFLSRLGVGLSETWPQDLLTSPR